MVFILCFFLASFPPLLAGNYDMADLRALSQEGSHREFLSHARDIRPSERNDEWKELVLRMAQAHAKETVTIDPIPREDFFLVEELSQWPTLRDNDDYRSRRTEIGLRFLGSCLSGSAPCWKELLGFWKLDARDPELSIGLAEMIKDRTDSPVPLWTLLEAPLKTPASEFYCRKPFIMKSLWEKLALDYLRLSKNGKLLSKIEDTIHPDCLGALTDTAHQMLRTPANPGDRELAFEILTSTGKDDQNLRDFFYALYLLEVPAQGELMNLAWNNLVQLGKSSSRRDRVLEALKDLDPLPDTIMGSLDLSKRRAVLRHFKANFPEYMDYYSSQCLAYYGGSKEFPKGNPTMKCRDLIGSDLAQEILPESKIHQFGKLQKI